MPASVAPVLCVRGMALLFRFGAELGFMDIICMFCTCVPIRKNNMCCDVLTWQTGEHIDLETRCEVEGEV